MPKDIQVPGEAPKVVNKTCDNCRKRKIKCVQPDAKPTTAPPSAFPDDGGYSQLAGLDAAGPSGSAIGANGASPGDLAGRCDGCAKLDLPCTYDYIRKKPGRKNSFAIAMLAQQERYHDPELYYPRSSPLNPSQPHTAYPSRDLPPSLAQAHGSMEPPQFPYSNPLDPSLRQSTYFADDLDAILNRPMNPSTSIRTSYNGGEYGIKNGESSAAGAMASSASSNSGVYNKGFSSFAFPMGLKDDPSLLWLDNMLDPSGGGIGVQSFGLPPDPVFGDLGRFPTEQAQLLSLESPENAMGLAMLPSPAGSAGTMPSAANTVGSSHHPGNLNDLVYAGSLGPNRQAVAVREPQLEDVTTWANISHFISLFLQYLYPLLPLVHRPTFTEHLATRRDLRDTDFRALLLSIVAYVISQLPTSRLVTDQFDIEGLKKLQRRCHRTGKQLQRTYYGPTNLTQITTIIFDVFYLLSIGLGHTAGARLGQAVNLAYSMGMHSDERTAALGLDAVEVQLRRRVFWQMYASDKTRAIPGLPMLLNDFQGTPSFPEATDDEHITSQGYFPQPADRTSVLAGFVSLSKIFTIISECFFHHRSVASSTTLALPHVGIEWTYSAEDRLHGVLRDMPEVMQDPLRNTDPAARQVFAMQRANVLITAGIAKFALYDLRAALHVDEDQLARERKANAREVYSLLTNIPVEDLASNGESVRAKVFHIACALCSQTVASDTDQELIRDWCNMFSAISFVQMPPPAPGAPQLDSRANSPPAPASALQGPGDLGPASTVGQATSTAGSGAGQVGSG